MKRKDVLSILKPAQKTTYCVISFAFFSKLTETPYRMWCLGWAGGWRWGGDYVIKGFCGGGWKCSKVEWWQRVWGSWVSTWSTVACALGSLVCCNSSVSVEASRMMLLRINWLQLEVFQLCCMRESLSEPCRLHLEWGPSEKKSR